ncbi:uncharacterized protein LOC111717639, partial [Eurytemora carolleeae]|uniref:uncharacterized protein LOC111717639 n=1 Tax=Eurytemora carolleeae TaxID=1294199 RepID=UPI000C76DA2A
RESVLRRRLRVTRLGLCLRVIVNEIPKKVVGQKREDDADLLMFIFLGQTNGFRNGMSQNGGSQFKIERSLNASVHMNGMKGIKADENMRRGLDDLEDGLDGMRDERSRSEEDRETWLQKQQRKLQERRLVPPGHQSSNQPGVNPTRPSSATQPGAHPSNPVIQELKTSLYRARSGYTETTDGYVSDGNSVF